MPTNSTVVIDGNGVINYNTSTINQILANAQTDHNAVTKLTSSMTASGNNFIANQIKTTAVTNTNYYLTGVASNALNDLKYNTSIYVSGSVIFGAAWNDYAELRRIKDKVEPGNCVYENGDGSMSKTTDRLQPAPAIISDTYGMCIGANENGSRPIAVCGRVLAFIEEKVTISDAGRAVCSGKNGTVSLMTREEIKEYPDRIVGYVSEIPDYDEWNGVKINGRIWIRIK